MTNYPPHRVFRLTPRFQQRFPLSPSCAWPSFVPALVYCLCFLTGTVGTVQSERRVRVAWAQILGSSFAPAQIWGTRKRAKYWGWDDCGRS